MFDCTNNLHTFKSVVHLGYVATIDPGVGAMFLVEIEAVNDVPRRRRQPVRSLKSAAQVRGQGIKPILEHEPHHRPKCKAHLSMGMLKLVTRGSKNTSILSPFLGPRLLHALELNKREGSIVGVSPSVKLREVPPFPIVEGRTMESTKGVNGMVGTEVVVVLPELVTVNQPGLSWAGDSTDPTILVARVYDTK
jgi:hypothetical protein